MEYKLDQKCDSSNSADGLYRTKDIIKEINAKLGSKYTSMRLSEWRAMTSRAIPDVIFNEIVNPDLRHVVKWYFVKKGHFNTDIDLDALADAFIVPTKQTQDKGA
jgi:hypothetical protein